MANKRTDYSKIEANKILKEFQSLSGADPLIYSQRPRDAYFRALLYKVLMDFNFMNDRQIAEFFLTKGITRTRVAIFHAISKVDIYYLNYSDFRDVYDVYFDDKAEESKVNSEKRAKKLKAIENKVVRSSPKAIPDLLKTLVDGIPDERRQEVYEMLNLRVKSWEWKSKNEYEIIEGDNGVGNNTWNQ